MGPFRFHLLVLKPVYSAGKDLIELHITLMRKIYLKSARADKWEASMLKFCSICPSLESELKQLQRYGYSALPMATKLSILRALCESQFDCNIKFKENIFNSYTASEMRLVPVGGHASTRVDTIKLTDS